MKKKKGFSFADMSRARRKEVAASGGRKTQQQADGMTGFALMPKAKLMTVLAKAKARRKGKQHVFTEAERRGANLMKGEFFEKLKRPLPTVRQKWIDIWTAADLLGIHVRTAYRWIDAGRLEAKPSGFHLVISMASIKQLRRESRDELKKYLKLSRR